MTNDSLSPAAHAVYDAAIYTPENATYRQIIAAALRAAARQLREAYANDVYPDHPDDWLFDIAAELEGGNEPTFTPEEVEMIQAPWSYLQSQQELEGGQ